MWHSRGAYDAGVLSPCTHCLHSWGHPNMPEHKNQLRVLLETWGPGPGPGEPDS